MAHPLFERGNSSASVTMHRLSNTVLTRKSLASFDVLFTGGSTGTQMHCVVSGSLRYVKMKSAEPIPVREGDWLCEPALWTSWFHLGEVQSTTDCQLVSVGAVAFGEAMSQDPALFLLVSDYAAKFVQWLNELDFDGLTDVSYAAQLHETVAGFLI